MPEVFNQTYSGTASGTNDDENYHIDVTSNISGIVLITEASIRLTNVDFNPSTTDDVEIKTSGVYTYVDAIGKYGASGEPREILPSIGVNTSRYDYTPTQTGQYTEDGPLEWAFFVGSNRDGIYVSDPDTFGVSITTGDTNIDFGSSLDYEIELVGRRMV